jgi:hypothetical protein
VLEGIAPHIIVSSELSPDLYELLADKLDSLEKLEIVLTLRAAARPISTADVATQLQVGHDALRPVIDHVVASGMAQMSDRGLVYRPGTWDPVLDEAAQVYANDPTKLMRAFTQIAMHRLRGMAARNFADAFRIRKKGS